MFDIKFEPDDIRYVIENHLVDALKDKTSKIGTIAFIMQATMDKLDELEAQTNNE